MENQTIKETVYLPAFKSINAGKNWYRNLQFLGKGGNGVTFLVSCTAGQFKGGIFALKIFYKMADKRRKERFLQEIEFMKKQHHPSIMRQYDEGEYVSKPFVVVEYLPNTLADEVEKRNITIGKGLIYALQLLSAAKHLADLNILHRDIKPQNIFINNNSAILGDFGLIKKLDSGIPGNPEDIKGYIAMPKFYRTPELVKYARGEEQLKLESDVFQLGLVFAFMFTNRNPLKGCLGDCLSDVELEPLNKINGSLSKEIAQVIRQMLIIDTAKRISLDKALDKFNFIFEKYANQKNKLDGQLFS